VALDEGEMIQVFGSSCGALVRDDMAHLYEWKPVDQVGRIDEMGEIERSISPVPSKRDGTVVGAHDLDVLVVEVDVYSEPAGMIPGWPPTDDVEIADGIDDASHQEGTASKDGVMALRQCHRSKEIEQLRAVARISQR